MNMNTTEVTVNGILSTGLDDKSKLHALERLRARVNFEITKIRKHRLQNYDFSTLPGIDDICVKTIIPYLCNDTQALVNMFARTTKRFLNVSTVQVAYYKIVLPRKYVCIPGNELIHGSKCGTLTLKDASILVNTLNHSIRLFENNDSMLHCLHYAGLNGHLSIVQFLVEEFDMDIHVKDGEGNCVTYLSALHGNMGVADYLVAKGGDLHNKNKGVLDRLTAHYKKEFPRISPLVCLCKKGRLEDVQLLIKAVHDVNSSNGNGMAVKEYVNKAGRTSTASRSREVTPLMAAAGGEHFQVVKYLIEQCEADPNIADSYGQNALHWAVGTKRTDTGVIQLLLNNMSLDSINKKSRWGYTPLDRAYKYNNRLLFNNSPIRYQEIIRLIRSKGGKANVHDENGRGLIKNSCIY